MPVYKYKSFEEARVHLAKLQSADPLERLARLERLLKNMQHRRKVERGIRRFKSLDEANAHRRQNDPA